MRGLIRFSMKNAVALFLIILMITGGGIYSIQKMNIEQYPNVDIPYLSMWVIYPGASPEQAMEDIGEKMEAELRGIEGIERMYTNGFANGFSATLQFEMDVDMDDAEQKVRNAVNKVKLPESALTPQFQRSTPDDPEIYSIGIYAEQDPDKVQDFVQGTVLPPLEGIQGIEEVKVSGTVDKKVFVRVLPEKLKEYRLTLDQIKQAILANNLSIPTGDITFADQILPLRINKKLHDVSEIKDIQLLLVNQDMSSLSNAFETIGDGMGQIGTSVGKVGENQGYQQAQIQLLVALQGLSAQLMADQMQLQQLVAQNQANPGSVPEQQIQEVQQKIQIEEAQMKQLQEQFQSVSNQIEERLKALGGSQGSAEASHTDPSISPNLTLSTVRLGDIAEVVYDNDTITNLARVNGKPAVTLGIIPTRGENVVAIVEQVEETMKEIPLPDGYNYEVLRDQSKQIEDSVYTMLKEAFLGALMAVVVTMLFLRNLRSTLIAIISIPLSILASFMVLDYLGYTLNIVTLSGIAVAVGRVVDDSIVVIENIFRSVRISKERDDHLVESSTHEVATAITSSTITTVAVFLPMAFVPGIVGKFFAPLAWTIVVSLLFSLLVAITVVPLMSRLFLLQLKPVEHKENGLQRVYRRTLQWSLSHRWMVLTFAILLLISSVALIAPKLGFNFLPQDKVRFYDTRITMPIGSTIEKTDHVSKQIEEILLSRSEIELVNTSVATENGAVSFVINESVEDTDALAEQLRQELKEVEGAKQILLTSIGGVGGSLQNDFILVINGPNLEVIQEAADKITEGLRNVPGLADVRATSDGLKPEIIYELDDQKLAVHGLYPGMVGLSVRNLVQGEAISNVEIDGKTTDLVLGLKLNEVDSLEALGEQKITNILGEEVALNDIGELKIVKNPIEITRLDQKDYIMLYGTITDPNTSSVNNAATKIVDGLDLPEGVTWYQEGASQAMNDGFKNMGIALGVSILLIYMVMVIAFGEATAPFVILFAIPFSVIGALLGLLLVGEPIGMPSMVGLLMLNGIVVTNAIVLLDRVKRNEEKGMTKLDALLEAGATRLRPILMTAIATIGALTPLALSTGAGLISRSLAIVVIGGLTTSTLLTLIIVPILYTLVHREKRKHSMLNSEAL